jgi:hypothetical protein
LSTKKIKFFIFFNSLSELELYKKIADSDSGGFALKFEHLFFKGYAAGGTETADFAVATDYTVARND